MSATSRSVEPSADRPEDFGAQLHRQDVSAFAHATVVSVTRFDIFSERALDASCGAIYAGELEGAQRQAGRGVAEERTAKAAAEVGGGSGMVQAELLRRRAEQRLSGGGRFPVRGCGCGACPCCRRSRAQHQFVVADLLGRRIGRTSGIVVLSQGGLLLASRSRSLASPRSRAPTVLLTSSPRDQVADPTVSRIESAIFWLIHSVFARSSVRRGTGASTRAQGFRPHTPRRAASSAEPAPVRRRALLT